MRLNCTLCKILCQSCLRPNKLPIPLKQPCQMIPHFTYNGFNGCLEPRVKKALRVYWRRYFSTKPVRPSWSSQVDHDQGPPARTGESDQRSSNLQERMETNTEKKTQSCTKWLILLLIFTILNFIITIAIAMKFTMRSQTPTEETLPKEFSDELIAQLPPKSETNSTTTLTTLPIMSMTTTDTPLCVLNTSTLGPIIMKGKLPFSFTTTATSILTDVVMEGGYFIPEGCKARDKVAILVPYRERVKNLQIFINNIHPFLMKQYLEYRIFIIEQYGEIVFNKGRLYNAGFIEMQKYGNWTCVVFHDVDLIPLDSRILYNCPRYPRHMSIVVLDHKGKSTSPRPFTFFGGVTAMTLQHYTMVNGHSNMYWGWGGEDNDMFVRIRNAKLPLLRYDKNIARYYALPHTRSSYVNPHRYHLLKNSLRYNGLATIEYKVKETLMQPLYTHIIVNINPNSQNITALLKWLSAEFIGEKVHIHVVDWNHNNY